MDAVRILKEDASWERLKGMLTKGFSGHKARNLEIVLENTRRSILTESTLSIDASADAITKLVIPVVRKLWYKLIAEEIVSVQPLEGPKGFVQVLKVIREADEREVPPLPDYTYSAAPVKTYDLATGDGSTATFSGNIGEPVAAQSVVVTVDGAPKLTDVNGDGKLAGSEGFGVIDYKTGEIQVTFNTPPASGAAIKVSYEPVGDNFTGRSIKIEIESFPVFARTRKLETTWTIESMDDFATLGIDLENEMFETVSNYLSAEINGIILNDLVSIAPFNEDWDSTPPTGVPAVDHYKSLILAINKVAAKIAEATAFANPNWIVCHPSAAVYLFPTREYSVANVDFVGGTTLGYQKIAGAIAQYTVYITPLVPSNTILVGYKGENPYEAGYVYAPYVPVKAIAKPQVTPGFVFYTRFGKLAYRPEFYGKVTIR